jgi:hypothetical protein
MKKASTKKSKKKISGKTEIQVPASPEPVNTESMTLVQLARAIQGEWNKVVLHKQEIESCQRNIWQLNVELDKREQNEKAPNEPRNKDEN